MTARSRLEDRASSPARWVFVLACALLAVSSARAATPSVLRVFAAASLQEGFGELARVFERDHAGVRVELNLAGSQQLAGQLALGAEADVFASADERWMEDVRAKGLLSGEPVRFARNALVVIVPRTNPARLARLSDLARRGVKIVIGAESVPVGRYGRDALRRLATRPGYPADYAARVLANVVSEEENVKGVVGKVQLGEADAGIVYRSDVSPALARYVRAMELPDSANVLASYPIAVLSGSRRPDDARAFVALVNSAEGQRVLARHGLLPASVP